MTGAPARRRSVRRQLAELVAWLAVDDDQELEVFGSNDPREWLLRLAGIALALTAEHRTDKTGRCHFCCTPPAGWRRWWPRLAKPTPCRVQRVAQLFARSTLDVAWWQVFQLVGEQRSIQEVRAWLAAQATTAVLPRVEDEGIDVAGDEHALLTDGRVLLRDEPTEGEHGRHSLNDGTASAVSVSELITLADSQNWRYPHEAGHSTFKIQRSK